MPSLARTPFREKQAEVCTIDLAVAIEVACAVGAGGGNCVAACIDERSGVVHACIAADPAVGQDRATPLKSNATHKFAASGS
jgi:hypothetical protein